MKKRHLLGFVVVPLLAAASVDAQVCVGNCGTLGPDGDVTVSPEGGTYQYVSSAGGLPGVGSLPGVGGDGEPENGSTYTTGLFGAEAGDPLAFYFNYVTSDGSGFADYAWARLLNSDLSQAALLFTARTTPGGNTVPGFGMPAPTVTLNPSTVVIDAGATNWSALGSDSGECYLGPTQGCGNTGWVLSQYTILTSGNYLLQFGVTNWNDSAYDSGLAFDGATIAGTPIDPTVAPEPVTLILMGTGLLGVGLVQRRRRLSFESA